MQGEDASKWKYCTWTVLVTGYSITGIETCALGWLATRHRRLGLATHTPMSSPSPVPSGGKYGSPSPVPSSLSAYSPKFSARSPEFDPHDPTFNLVPGFQQQGTVAEPWERLLANQERLLANQMQQEARLLAALASFQQESALQHEENLTAHSATKMAAEENVQQMRRLTDDLDALRAEAQEEIEKVESKRQARAEEIEKIGEKIEEMMRQEHQVRSSDERTRLAMHKSCQTRVRSHDCAFLCLT